MEGTHIWVPNEWHLAYKYFPHSISESFLFARNYYPILQIIIKPRRKKWAPARNLLERCFETKSVSYERNSTMLLMDGQRWACPSSGETVALGIQTMWNLATRPPLRLLKAYSQAAPPDHPTSASDPQKKWGWAVSWPGGQGRDYTLLQSDLHSHWPATHLYLALSAKFGQQGGWEGQMPSAPPLARRDTGRAAHVPS